MRTVEWAGKTVHKLSQRRLTANRRVTVHGFTVRSPLTGSQVTSRPPDWSLRYSKWLDTFWTALIRCAWIKDRVGDEPMGIVLDGVLVSEMGLVKGYDIHKVAVH
jgi:hypothetical protein